jgi:beta-lactamase regulating signal transducer with metallopeptidase domain
MNNHFSNGPALWLAQATLLLGCFWTAYGTLKSHPRARVILCRMVSVALLALPLLSLAPVSPILHFPAPTLPATMIDSQVPVAIPAPVIEPSPSTGVSLPVEGTVQDIQDIHPAASSHLPAVTPVQALMSIWCLGSAFLMIRWLMALKMARRLVRSAQEPPGWAHEIQAEIASHLHLAARVRLGVIDEVGSPLLLGPRPVILLPRHLLEEDAQDDFVPSLAHELVHVKEGDWWWSQWLQLVAAILWPIPPIWFLRKAHDSAAEIVCDSIAASLVGGTELYAGTLARQSLHALGRPQLAVIPMLRRSGIRQRIDLLLSGLTLPTFSRRSMMMTGLLTLLACGALSGIRVAAAGDAPIAPTSPTTPTAATTPVVVAPTPDAAPTKPALKEIEPYGGISWNDGVFQVIQKIKKIEGITNITWVDTSGNVHPNPIDLTAITTPEELNAAFEKMILQHLSGYRQPPSSQYSNNNLDMPLYTYKDASGNDKKYVSDSGLIGNPIGNSLTAGPIILAGHPFTLCVAFKSYPGFAVQFPDQVIKLPNYQGAVGPLAITSVKLVTDTNLSDDARNTIIDKLIAKYGITEVGVIKDLKSVFDVTIANRGPARLVISLNNNRTIMYDYDPRYDLIQYYSNLLTKLAEQAAKKEPDGTNGL